jgi:hypothetical protein
MNPETATSVPRTRDDRDNDDQNPEETGTDRVKP